MSDANGEDYIPRSDLGFPDRRKKSRARFVFEDEASIDRWESGDSSDERLPRALKESAAS